MTEPIAPLIAQLRGICGAANVLTHDDPGTDLSACVAIGDEMNDFEMLRDVGFGIAMGQAPDSLKSVAKAITSSNTEDGVAEAIARWVLPFA